MTQNQVAYWNLQELKRHNAATEQETNRANIAQETETARKNRTSESLQLMTHQEAVRHNQSVENINIAQLTETKRHNQVAEQETRRHNLLSSSIQASQAATREQERITNQRKLDLEREKFEFDKSLQTINTGIKGVDVGLKVVRNVFSALK